MATKWPHSPQQRANRVHGCNFGVWFGCQKTEKVAGDRADWSYRAGNVQASAAVFLKDQSGCYGPMLTHISGLLL